MYYAEKNNEKSITDYNTYRINTFVEEYLSLQ